jgi:hypothetical protein
VRFREYHKKLCAILSLEPEQARECEVLVRRYYARGLSLNAGLTLLKLARAEQLQLSIDGSQSA